MCQKTLLIIGLSFLALGCVAKRTHNETIASNIKLSSDLKKVTHERNQLTQETEDLKEKIQDLEQRNEELSSTNQILVNKNKRYAESSMESQTELIKIREEKLKAEEKVEFISKTYDDLVKTLKREIEEGNVRVDKKGSRLSVNMSNRVLFASGSAKIQTQGQKILKKVVKILKKVKGKRIVVEGHTDNVPIRGVLKTKFGSNWELSTARATQVVRFLQRQGVPGKKLSASGFGPYQPLASNKTAKGRKQNRRIEIVLAPPI